MGRAEDGGFREASGAAFLRFRPTDLRDVEPIADVDERRHRESGVVERASKLREGSPRGPVGVGIGEPEFQGLEPGEGRRLDLAEHGGAADRGRVETESEGRHAGRWPEGAKLDRENVGSSHFIVHGR